MQNDVMYTKVNNNTLLGLRHLLTFFEGASHCKAAPLLTNNFHAILIKRLYTHRFFYFSLMYHYVYILAYFTGRSKTSTSQYKEHTCRFLGDALRLVSPSSLIKKNCYKLI